MESINAESVNYRNLAKGLGSRRSLGQNFLVKRSIAVMEAAYAKGMNVVELGPGLGILTRELCRTAKRVVAVEKDAALFDILNSTLISSRLRLIRGDFFSIDAKELGDIDIMVSNIPYNLSSKVVYWLSSRNMPALICVQREFADHMLAEPGTRSYSRLSVITALTLRAHRIRNVAAGSFVPSPRVDSCIIYLAPKDVVIDRGAIRVMSLIMSHKKKRIRNAIVDSARGLGISKKDADRVFLGLGIANERPFAMEPGRLLEISEKICGLVSQKE